MFERVRAWLSGSPPRGPDGDGDYTERQIRDLIREATSGATAGDLLVTAACLRLWESALASATVTPADSRLLMPVTAGMLAIVGRDLASRGESVWAIQVDGGRVRLNPASYWDVTGGVDESRWRYRLDLQGPTTTRTIDTTADGVVHVRIGADSRVPWRGKSPLRQGTKTAHLAALVETSLQREAAIKPARVAPYGGDPDQRKTYANRLRGGGVLVPAAGPAGLVSSVMEPGSRLKPQTMGPEPDQVLHAVRTSTGQDILAAYGIPPVLLSGTGDGAARREAYRQFWLTVVEPVGAIIQEEVRQKLDPAATLGFEGLAAHDVDSRSRAVTRRAQAYSVLRAAGMTDSEARQYAGLEVM